MTLFDFRYAVVSRKQIPDSWFVPKRGETEASLGTETG